MLLLQACVASSLVEVPQPDSHWECKARDLNLQVLSQGEPPFLPGKICLFLVEETALVILGPWDAKGRVQ